MKFVYCMHIAPALCENTEDDRESEGSSIDSCTEATEGESGDESNPDASQPVELPAEQASYNR